MMVRDACSRCILLFPRHVIWGEMLFFSVRGVVQAFFLGTAVELFLSLVVMGR